MFCGDVQMNSESNPVREVRDALKLTQKEMAERLQTSVMTVRRCEYEKRIPGTIGVRAAFERLAKQAEAQPEAAR